ncbi:MAG: hypothetical protein PHY73_00550 [Candidatus Omnitrophica bacterium]|nr:hypothetical protein [Candidatus Omnitrophota bacterium]
MNKKNAQSPLEYIMIIIAVIASITAMGPYVIRGVNAYMRSWEISAEQTQRDTRARLNAWEVPGAEPPLSVECGYFSTDQSGCKAAVGEDGSRCWWWQQYEEVTDNPGDCAVTFDTCRMRGSTTSGFIVINGCTMSDNFCNVTYDEDCNFAT